LAGRDEPPLPAARLRAGGKLTEIGVGDLALTDAEAASLLRTAGVMLGEAELAELHQRTEGWPAGLYLAALYLREGGATPGAAASFGGGDRLVSEYVESEFLVRISPRQREFLTRTAVLERMCGPLCEAVLELPGSGGCPHARRRGPPSPGGPCRWCRWTGAGSGTATTTYSATCCSPSWNGWNPNCCRFCGAAPPPGGCKTGCQRKRWSTSWPPGT